MQPLFPIPRFGKAGKLAVAAASLLLLAGCGAHGTIDSDTPGMFNHYVVFPLAWLLRTLANGLQDNYGLALIGVTLLVRLVLMPLMLRQYRSQQIMKGKMKRMQPELEALKARHNGKGTEALQKQQQETMELYKKHGYNPLAIGCLPMLVQLPILTGLYYAIRMSPELSSHSFLWFQLGQPDLVLPFLAAGVYYVQAKLSQRGVEMNDMQRQMSWMVYLSPVMMGVFSFTAPAALPLYWTVGGLILIAQTLLGQRLYRHLAEEPAAQPELVLSGKPSAAAGQAGAKGTR
ncbi:membrane protein insertase YidC [Paenibacillus pasadenensis]|uniref:membrane protein insertase YidC n=1 Tax=Paenibacillus pasadenensis TaxID=217090 RepID=UPI00203E5875|nr:membrane protein insertase YidC [Paenibacillus pasadenensis]MCM3747696.1 membrane protein insertase YidC [Paenibacillus pasadenensis]